MLPALRRALPDERFVYVADSGHAPYGDRPLEHLRSRSHAVCGFLKAQGAKALVLACNTLSVAMARELREQHGLPLVAMEPAIKPAVAATGSGRVLVMATSGTIASEAVARLCREHGGQTQITLQACPGLVEQVERGEWDSPATRSLLQRYVSPALGQGADTIVLGCTHYAFLTGAITALAGPGVTLIEPSEAIARQLMRVNPAPGRGAAPTAFHTSGDNAALQRLVKHIGEPSAGVFTLPV